MKQLLQGIADDQKAYGALLELLEQQLRAAIGHKLDELGRIAEAIGALAAELEARRARRVELVGALQGAGSGMDAVFALLRPEAKARAEADWQALEGMVVEAKQRSRRNADLLADQFTIMQRVLHGEDQIYEPA
jgi:flagella synthesis protein FlgN